jgi:hypothetical protein
MVIPFDNEILKGWFLEAFPSVPCGENFVSTVGSEPYPENVFDDLLRSGGLEVFNIHDETDVLIIGREEWDEEELNVLLDRREGQHLKVYSQEMFLAYWIAGRDPFEDEDVARAFGEAHPALEYLSNCWLAWPSTFVSRSGGGGLLLESPELGMLRYMGYKVGERGLPAAERRAILAEVFSSKLENINSPEYMQGWGRPKSKERLKKMADSMAAFCQSQKRKGNDLAASHYEEDLRWLYKNYYSGRFKFKWPRFYVG